MSRSSKDNRRNERIRTRIATMNKLLMRRPLTDVNEEYSAIINYLSLFSLAYLLKGHANAKDRSMIERLSGLIGNTINNELRRLENAKSIAVDVMVGEEGSFSEADIDRESVMKRAAEIFNFLKEGPLADTYGEYVALLNLFVNCSLSNALRINAGRGPTPDEIKDLVQDVNRLLETRVKAIVEKADARMAPSAN